MNKIRVSSDRMYEYSSIIPVPKGQVQFSKILFYLSEDWTERDIIVQFQQGEKILNIGLEPDNICHIPSDFDVGIVTVYLKGYGLDGSSIATANGVSIPIVQGAFDGGDPAVPPDPDLYQKLIQSVQQTTGNLNDLKTEDKSSVVAAINEVFGFGGGGSGGTTDHAKLSNRDADDQHPMSAITGLEDAMEGKQPTGDYLESSLWVVNITQNSDGTYSADKTFEEIKEAYNAGKYYIVAELFPIVLMLSGVNTRMCGFTGIIVDPDPLIFTLSILSDNSVFYQCSTLADIDYIPTTAEDVGADPAGTAESKVSTHNTETTSHNDIRLLIKDLTDRLNALADSDDTTLDQLSEIVAYIKSNRDLIDAITTSKVSVTDIVDNLTTNVTDKPLSAAQGVALKALVDAIAIPEKLPNPNALTFTGAVTGSYDGSAPLTVDIPSGGESGGIDPGQWEYLGEFTESDQPTFENGKYRFFYAEAFFTSEVSSAIVYRYPCIDGYTYCRWGFANVLSQKMRMFIAHGLCSLVHAAGTGTSYPTNVDRGNAVLHPAEVNDASKGTAFFASTDEINYPISTFGIKLWGAK